MTRDRIAATAATLMSAVAAAISLFAVPMLQDAHLATKALAAAAGTLSLYGIFILVTHVLAHRRYKSLLGRWYYITYPHGDSPHKDGNVAAMTFRLNRDYDIEYSVDIYGSLDELRNPAGATLKGHAKSHALSYDVDSGEVHIVFYVSYILGDADNISRRGRLSLRLTKGGVIAGEWTSEVKKFEKAGAQPVRVVSSGAMNAFRSVDALEKFVETFDNARRAETAHLHP